MAKTKKQVKKVMKITRERALKLFSYFNYKTAGKWSSKRMEGKLAKLPDSIDIKVVKNSKVKAILKDIMNASSIEIASSEKTKVDVKAKITAKPEIKSKKKTKKVSKKSAKKTKGRFNKKQKTKTTTKKTEKTPGVIMSVLEFIQKDGPISTKKILAKLAARFPDRSSESMERTIPRVPNHLKTNFGIDKIRKNDKGNYYAKK